MAFDGIVTSNVVAELNTCLIGGKINKVFEPNKNEVILGIYSHGVNYALNFSIASDSYRINLTTHLYQLVTTIFHNHFDSISYFLKSSGHYYQLPLVPFPRKT